MAIWLKDLLRPDSHTKYDTFKRYVRLSLDEYADDNLDNLSTKWTIWHFYGDKKSIIPALVPALQYP